ncbi:2-dehydro-3-deoxygalactonokinase [Pseudozobellia thermophila]|uniref:2-dehydro-3-deoxygalactonokinase n=1 Tax=Pseudozobellia thermophila TaxID=192903 RepID=A0A1M6BB20_9FLAO|nr:2-dehydro-3-deoxygalactonokinase [Pseudozobellia thermophila]SHI45867.1 2-dehydro-3-deoxygalactonokinase [Pseudozobellia thermophila]
MKPPDFFISCDWGTSNFRVSAVDRATLGLISSIKSSEGVKARFRKFEAGQGMPRADFFLSYLLEQIGKLDVPHLKNTVIVGSGMLSSSIGMKELPYADMPFSFSGQELLKERFELPNGNHMVLISGVKTPNDVMRGEEVQAIGIAEQLPDTGKGVLILPGTHSKHIYFNNGRFERFTTFMTGELYEVIGTHSILAPSLQQADWDDVYEDVFMEGVKKGLANTAIASLFSIRANSLLNKASPINNSFFLSGLLIGSELASLVDKNEKIYLGATGIQRKLYMLALKYISAIDDLLCFNTTDMQHALFAGQLKILKTYV